MYFEKMPKLDYKLPLQYSLEMTDIFRRVAFTESIRNDDGNFETYLVKEGQRPEDVAADFYDDPSWWWLVMMCNDILNVESEWPKSMDQINTLFNNFLNGYSYFVFEDLDILPNDVMVKRDTGATAGIATGHYGVISSYDRLLHKIDVKQYEGSIDAGDEINIFREGVSGSGDYSLISGFGGTSCVQPYYGSTSCVVFTGPSAGGGAPLCATAGCTFAKIQKRTTIKNSVAEFEYNYELINPYSGVVGGGPSGDFMKFQNICGMTGTVIHQYINDTLSTNIKSTSVHLKTITENTKKRTIRLLSPSIALKASIELGVLLKGNVPRGTTSIIE
jgi:hypothetical protein